MTYDPDPVNQKRLHKRQMRAAKRIFTGKTVRVFGQHTGVVKKVFEHDAPVDWVALIIMGEQSCIAHPEDIELVTYTHAKYVVLDYLHTIGEIKP